MNIYFCGDIHAGHQNIPRYRKEFESEEHHFEYVKERYHKRVGKRDHVYFMGDTAFTKERIADIAKWAGAKKVLILGNHCTNTGGGLHIRDIVPHFDEVHGLIKYHEFWLTHAPIHQDELRGRFCIHGHTHQHVIKDWRYINVCPEQTDYFPISLHEIREIVNTRRNDMGNPLGLIV